MKYLDETGFEYFWENKIKPIKDKAEAAENSANEAAEALKWKFVGEYVGQESVKLDSAWKEAYVVVLINSSVSSCVTFHVLRDEIQNIISTGNTYAFYRQGYYYLASNNSGTTLRFGIDNVYMHQVVSTGVDVTASSIWRVYWR